MSYFLSPALEKLRVQINARWPNRDKTSDGWIGDASHSARKSDHNPDYSDGGIVRAIDVDKDGVDMDLITSIVLPDPRTWYVIWNGRIAYGQHVEGVVQGWRTYTGSNSHTKHMHISVRKVGNYDRDSSLWNFPGVITPPVTSPSNLEKIMTSKITDLGKKITVLTAISRLLILLRQNRTQNLRIEKKLDQLLKEKK